MLKTIINKEIRRLRKELKSLDINCSQIARKSGLSTQWIRNFESGEPINPTVDSLIKLDVFLRKVLRK